LKILEILLEYFNPYGQEIGSDRIFGVFWDLLNIFGHNFEIFEEKILKI